LSNLGNKVQRTRIRLRKCDKKSDNQQFRLALLHRSDMTFAIANLDSEMCISRRDGKGRGEWPTQYACSLKSKNSNQLLRVFSKGDSKMDSNTFNGSFKIKHIKENHCLSTAKKIKGDKRYSTTKKGGYVRWMKCDDNNNAQLWKFEVLK